MSDIYSILDSSIDDLADLPAFPAYPTGAHKVTISFERKEVNNHPSVEMKMTLVESVEVADGSEPPAPGTQCSALFMLDNEFGQGNLKNVIKPLAAACGTGSISETMEAAKGMEVTVVVKTKADKKDPDIMRMNVTKVIV